MARKKPLVSIIIVNFNGEIHLKKCLDSIFKNDYPDFEILVVDNGSDDGTREMLSDYMDRNRTLKSIFLQSNMGPSFARNVGVSNSSGKYLAFLDNDTQVHKAWLSKTITYMENNTKIGACQCKLLLMDDPQKIDYVGDYFTRTGFLMQPNKIGDLASEIPSEIVEIFAAKSAGMIVRQKAYELARGFDDDYFIYMEETDLCWRIWLAGFRIVYFPDSIVYHKFGTSHRLFPVYQSYLARFHGSKNYLTTLIKNLSTGELLIILPINVFLWLVVAAQQLVTLKIKSGIHILSGLLWVPLNLITILGKRKNTQNSRKISDKELFKHILKPVQAQYFLDKFFSKSTVKGFKAINEK